uniref:Uncharacterized protein n=1 Tax=Podoviridae sp. cttot15 TaxID=2827751 RepID=A0A8S5TMG8_9CAUD|nr:MAG TPA: hypothetical protein [Podoviridae sp. cttot15]
MIEFNTWDTTNNISYIIGLIMFEQVELLHNLYEGYDVHIERCSNSEYWTIVFEDESLVLRFNIDHSFSMRLTLFDKALKELKTRIKRKHSTSIIQKQLFTQIVKEAIKYRQHIRLRWGDFTVTVKPHGDNLSWFIRYKNDVLKFVSTPCSNEAEEILDQFAAIEGPIDES